jgi:hypothetical protein
MTYGRGLLTALPLLAVVVVGAVLQVGLGGTQAPGVRGPP